MLAECNLRPAVAPSTDRAAHDGAAAEAAGAMAADRARAWLDVDLGALVRNAQRVRARAGVPLLPMIKAEAYGLGAVAAARALAAVEPWGFGVASVVEGETLRGAHVGARLVVFTPLVGDDLARADRAGLTPSLHRAEDVRRWHALGGGAWHLAVDTGMARAGVRWDAIDGALLDAVCAHPPEGAYTHFHSAELADGSRGEQEARFRAAIARLPHRPPLLHAENSPAVERGGASAWNLVRPGLYLYGASCVERDAPGPNAPSPNVPSPNAPAPNAPAPNAFPVDFPPPEPVAHLRARIVDLRDLRAGEPVSYGATWRASGPRRIATLAVGYADGYRRSLSGRGAALVAGSVAPVVGRVTMDMTMIDVTGLPCAVGDVATLLGGDGRRVLTVAEVAARGALSPYELLVGLCLRLPHCYHGPCTTAGDCAL